MANPPDLPKLVFDWSELGQQGFTTPDRVTINDDAVMLTREGLLRVDRLLGAFYRPEHSGIRYS